ncbi:hypothetical protein MJM43_31110, partial [Salmonella enterica subsp. enterica serovar Montevideo]|nr:hypothetical protein [Salmonella enterica subsp. enterica serovar Montevideo]
MNDRDFMRYSRQILLGDIAIEGQQKLLASHVLTTVPSLQIGRLEVTDSSLQGPDWAVTDLDLSLRNLTLRKED